MLVRLTAIACAVVLMGGVVTLAFGAGRAMGTPAADYTTADSPENPDLVEEVIGRLGREAVNTPEEEKLIRGAVEGVLRALGDEHAAYYDPKEYAAFNQMLDGEFSGVGLELQQRNKAIIIVRVLEKAPAARAGVRRGEQIVAVNGRDVRGKPIDLVVSMVKGPAGTKVSLGLKSAQGTRTVTLERETIALPSFQARLLPDGTGLIELRQFTSGVGNEVRTAVDHLTAEGARGIVLDLRGNPGGLLPEAIAVASVFIEEGPVVTVKERNAKPQTYRAQGEATTLPLVTLVDRYSASASEIVAGAIQDADRGAVIGQPTFGKGTVQTIQRLDAGGGLKFTTAEYFTPSGDSIEDKGVQPDDRIVDRPRTSRDEALAEARNRLSELVAADA